MAPKKKEKKEPDTPKVNVEEVMMQITQLAEEIGNLKQDIDDRAKDHADSLSQYDVSYPLSCLLIHNEILYSGSLDREIVGIDTKTRQQKFKVVASTAVHCVFVMPECGILFAGTEGLIQSWNASSSEPYGEFNGHGDRVTCLRGLQGDLMSSSKDGTLRRWARKTQRCLRSYDVCEYPVSAFEIDGDSAYCATWDNCVRCIDLKTGATQNVYKGHDHIINSLSLMNKAGMNEEDAAKAEAKGLKGLMYTGSADHDIMAWELQEEDVEPYEKKALRVLKGHADSIFTISVLDVPSFVSVLTGETEVPPEGQTEQNVSSRPKHNIPEHDLASLRDKEMPSRILIAGSDDRSVRLFDAETGMCMLVLIGHTDGVSELCMSEGVLYSASYDRTIRSWDLKEALVRIQMRRKLKTLEQAKLDAEGVLEANSKGKKKKGKKKKK